MDGHPRWMEDGWMVGRLKWMVFMDEQMNGWRMAAGCMDAGWIIDGSKDGQQMDERIDDRWMD